VSEQIDGEHAVGAIQARHHPVPPVDRAAEAVDEDDWAASPRAAVDHLDLAARQVEDAPAGFGRPGFLGFVVDDHGVDGEQCREHDHCPDCDLCPSAHGGRYPSRTMRREDR